MDYFNKKLLNRLREETQGCKKQIHFNNAGAALMPAPVISAIKEYLDLEGEIGGYEAADLKEREIYQFYTKMASFLNCQDRNIAFTYNATDSYARALSSIPFEKEDIILTSMNDYISNQIAFLSLKNRMDVRIMRVPDHANGGINLDQAESMIKMFRPKLVAITHVPTNSGLVQDIETMGLICRRYGIIYLVDACQSVGQLEVDVKKIGCDFLSGTFRKFLRGPRGAGFLYISDEVLERNLEPMFIDMRGANWVEEDKYEAQKTAKRFEQWEFPYALLMGSTVCVQYAMDLGMKNISKRVQSLASQLRRKLGQFDNIRVLDKGEYKCGIVSFWVAGWRGEELKTKLNEKKVNCSLNRIEDNIMDFTEKNVEWSIRVSPHYYNTEVEIDQFMEILGQIID